MIDQGDVARDLVQRAHAEEVRPGFDIEAGVSDVLTRAGVFQPALAAPADANRHRLLDELPLAHNTVNKKNVALLPPRLRYPLARRHTRMLERMRQEGEQRLAWRVQDIIVGLGLTQADFSLGGGRTLHIPEVISVTERPVGLDIRMLPGQMPDDFAAHAPAIAYNLGVAEVRVVPLGPSLIRLILLPGV
jgi:hypothetical protein